MPDVEDLLNRAANEGYKVRLTGDPPRLEITGRKGRIYDELVEFGEQIKAHLNGDSLYGESPEDVDKSDDAWPEPLADEAFHGLVGEIVRTIDPHSEADRAAILIQSLIVFGNLIGRNAHFCAEADRHYGNVFAVLVGETSKGRKGSSWSQVKRLVALVADGFVKNNTGDGLSSGEGLIQNVRDPITKSEPIREDGRRHGKIVDFQDVTIDEGVTDKRLIIIESEFSSVLQNCAREKNILSATIRQAWDTGNLRTMAKNSPSRAKDAHISIIGHITRDELRRLITSTELANGFANRFLWMCVRRSKLLPDGGDLSDEALIPSATKLSASVQFAQSCHELARDEEAKAIWHEVYGELSAGRLGLLGSATSRAEAQVMRLAMLYSLLDQSRLIKAEHLMAGLAIWKYAEESAKYIFGSNLGDELADRILAMLRDAHPDGLSRTDIRDAFQRHKDKQSIDRALRLLEASSLARREKAPTTGRPAEIWFAIT